MTTDTAVLLGMFWTFLIIFVTPGCLGIMIYHKFQGLSSSKAFIKAFTGWFYLFVILSGVSAYQVYMYHPAFN